MSAPRQASKAGCMTLIVVFYVVVLPIWVWGLMHDVKVALFMSMVVFGPTWFLFDTKPWRMNEAQLNDPTAFISPEDQAEIAAMRLDRPDPAAKPDEPLGPGYENYAQPPRDGDR